MTRNILARIIKDESGRYGDRVRIDRRTGGMAAMGGAYIALGH